MSEEKLNTGFAFQTIEKITGTILDSVEKIYPQSIPPTLEQYEFIFGQLKLRMNGYVKAIDKRERSNILLFADELRKMADDLNKNEDFYVNLGEKTNQSKIFSGFIEDIKQKINEIDTDIEIDPV